MFRPTRYKFLDTQEIKIKYNLKNLQNLSNLNDKTTLVSNIFRLRDYDRVHFNCVNLLI